LEVTGNRQALILCRRLQVSQVLINLLNNARHAVDGSEKKVVQIHCRNDRGQVEISVTDSGVGIPEEFANKIFLPFFTTKEVGKGTGLGLSISKGLIQNQNGKLELEILPVGTKFTITLPIAESREAAA
jgi:signal transduction histidine kinase